MPKFGVITGSGLYDIPGFERKDSIRLETPFGEPSDLYITGSLSGKELVFLPRHGSGHTLQPHRINYRANIWGFKELGVERLLSISASGGISREMKPGLIAAPHQIIDLTSGRKNTFYEGDEVVHIDFTEPFCPDLRNYIFAASGKSGVPVTKSGVYICVNGPRLETAAEIRTFSSWGADMVGMTAMPETVLAREMEICFAALNIITNFAAGITSKRLGTTEVAETMGRSMKRLESLLAAFFALDFAVPACACRHALQDAKM